jgi:hypothetical protein
MRLFAAGVRLAGLLLLVVVLPGCDDEPAQRKAFIEFLQTRIIDKPGIHVPHLTDDEAKKFGPYAKDYAIIADFNGNLDNSIAAPMDQALQRGSITSIGDVVGRHADFVAVRDGMTQLRAALDKQSAAADAAHAALKQPDDVKPVYDKAYERDVTTPAKAFADIFPVAADGLDAIIALGDFLDKHKGEIQINGPLLQTNDAALRAQLQQMIDTAGAKAEAMTKAQQRLQAIATGG